MESRTEQKLPDGKVTEAINAATSERSGKNTSVEYDFTFIS